MALLLLAGATEAQAAERGPSVRWGVGGGAVRGGAGADSSVESGRERVGYGTIQAVVSFLLFFCSGILLFAFTALTYKF